MVNDDIKTEYLIAEVAIARGSVEIVCESGLNRYDSLDDKVFDFLPDLIPIETLGLESPNQRFQTPLAGALFLLIIILASLFVVRCFLVDAEVSEVSKFALAVLGGVGLSRESDKAILVHVNHKWFE